MVDTPTIPELKLTPAEQAELDRTEASLKLVTEAKSRLPEGDPVLADLNRAGDRLERRATDIKKGPQTIKGRIWEREGKNRKERIVAIHVREKTLEFKKWLHALELDGFADAIPDDFRISPEDMDLFEREIEMFELDDMLVMPDLAIIAKFRGLIAQRIHTKMEGLPKNMQYDKESGIWLSDTVNPHFPDGIVTLDRPEGPYIKLFSNNLEPDKETLGMSADRVQEKVKEHQEVGLTNVVAGTIDERFFEQRITTEKYKQHPETSYWGWTPDSVIPDGAKKIEDGGVSRPLDAGWRPSYRRFSVNSAPSDSHRDDLGARFSAISRVI